MATSKLDGQEIQLAGKIPEIGGEAPKFTIVKSDLTEMKLSDLAGNVIVIMSIPSLETGVCSKEIRTFNEKLSGMNGVKGLMVSKDLPFAMHRFCEVEGIENVIPGSDFRYGEFGRQYGMGILDGAFKGLLARAVFIVDKNMQLRYLELVDDIAHEPDYSMALDVVNKLLKD
ncbi:thiol peroxidase [Marinigracilibium pacificum]|uniref:Thiol peroxidase n=1 Tax=Marinigracilibium pacificum TaxID=2729599 RepID=A0A848IZQ6_9BACT|nr:thiol peroxidase [Marinigracilibium pacificum]NMM48628.1 thiol peroxidase [Marinigracilibium pacificum]